MDGWCSWGFYFYLGRKGISFIAFVFVYLIRLEFLNVSTRWISHVIIIHAFVIVIRYYAFVGLFNICLCACVCMWPFYEGIVWHIEYKMNATITLLLGSN